MKKICFLADRNVYLKRICNFLVENGFEIHLICRSEKGLKESEFNRKIKFYQLKNKRLISKIFEIYSLLNKISPDFVHVHQVHKDAYLLPRINRNFKYLITFWGSDLNVRSKNIVDRFFQNLSILSADKIHLLSENFLNQLRKKYHFVNENKIEIFYWGVDVSSFIRNEKQIFDELKKELGICEKDKLILSYRNHSPLYNHHTLIKSIPDVINKYPHIKFVFTRGSCDEKYFEENMRLVKRLGVQENFVFINRWLDDLELSTLLNNAEISVSIPIYDGLPATLFEIMSTKSIPLISNLDSYKGFFNENENGFFVNDKQNVKELSDKILTILNLSEELKDKIVNNNNSIVSKKYDWFKQSEKYLKLYKN